MKQSTKLLSLVLALVMAFSCMTVIGNAASTITSTSSVTYDSIDDAIAKKNTSFLYKFYYCNKRLIYV